MTRTVLVTGGSGYVASRLISQLLERGDLVRTTIRNFDDRKKCAPLRALQLQYPQKLEIFSADLLRAGSFGPAMTGCSIVYHVASPFKLPEKIVDGRREMLDPALLGTRNVLASINDTPSVQRLVFTSTVGAIFGDYIDVLDMDGQILSESYFNTSSTIDNNPYHYAKTMAEREAWSICKAQTRWSMVSINPGLILGPSLTPASESGSLFLLDEMIRGYFFYGAPNLSFTTVDVREVALAHIRAAENDDAQGRYILAEKKMISFLEVAKILRRVHKRPIFLPKAQIPDWLVRVVGPRFGLKQDYITKHLGIRFAVDNARSLTDLGITYRPIEETLVDHYHSWAAGARLDA